MCSLGATSVVLPLLLLLTFGFNVSHQWIMFAKLLYLVLVSFHCNSLITVNDTEIFVCINDTPLLNVTFLYASKYTTDNILQEFLSPGTKVPGDKRSMELSSPRTKVPSDESSSERKFYPMELSCLGTKVLRDESSLIRSIDQVSK